MASGHSKTRAAIAEEAAEWFVEWREEAPSRTEKLRFTDWLSESPVHVEEYLAIARLYGELTHVDPAKVADLNTFVDDTIVALHQTQLGLEQAADAAAIIDLKSSVIIDAEPEERSASPSRALRRWGVAATVLIAATASLYFYLGIDDTSEIYATGLGEQRSVLLDDGSMVSLNTESGMAVAYTDTERRITLTHGEALFDVKEEIERPFWVETGAALIRVTGTQFNVHTQNGQTAITVIEGTVEVASRVSPTTQLLGTPNDSSSMHSGEIAKLRVGDQAVVKSGSVAIDATKVENLEPVTAWTERRLVFSETPLSEIVAEFNRYNHQRLILDDATVATLEVSGVFSTHDPESLVLFLERIADVEVDRSSDGSEIRVRAAGTSP